MLDLGGLTTPTRAPTNDKEKNRDHARRLNQKSIRRESPQSWRAACATLRSPNHRLECFRKDIARKGSSWRAFFYLALKRTFFWFLREQVYTFFSDAPPKYTWYVGSKCFYENCWIGPQGRSSASEKFLCSSLQPPPQPGPMVRLVSWSPIVIRP